MQNSENPGVIDFRPASPASAGVAGPLIFETFPEVAEFIIGLGDAERAQAALTQIFQFDGHAFSHSLTTMVLADTQVVGLYIAFPGWMESVFNRHLAKRLLKRFSLAENLVLMYRGFSLLWIKEAERDEYLLSNLAVKKDYRGQGIGTKILQHVEQEAKKVSLNKVALMVSTENAGAQRLYQRQGYLTKETYHFPGRRFPDNMPGFRRMVKELEL